MSEAPKNPEENVKTAFDKTTVKHMKLKSRVFLGPCIHTAPKIEAIVQNEVAMVTTEGCIIGDYLFTKLQPEGPFRIDSDEYLPEIKNLADIAHKYDSYILLDLLHQGMASSEHFTPSGGKALMGLDIETKAMTKEDILKVEDYFVQAALRAKKAGFDGVEIHGGQLSLVSLFCSSKYNQRTDEYGGSDEKRTKFIIEILQKIREAIGNDMIISAKIDNPCEEHGFTESGFITTAKALEENGLDMIEISGPNPHRNGDKPYFYEDTKKLAEILKIPVTCIGGIKSYEQVDYILKNSKIQYVAMSRELLKQPDIVKQWYLNKK